MKKNFKKMVALATATVLTLSMSVSAFAVDQYDRELHDTVETTDKSTAFDSRSDKYSGDSYRFDNLETTESYTSRNSTDSAKVKVTVNDNSCTKIYNVTVAWDDLEFTYTFNAASIWSPEEHKYVFNGATEPTEPGTWSDKATVTITNHSNKKLNTSIAPTTNTDDAYDVQVKAAIKSDSDVTLEDASECAYGDTDKADKAVYEVWVEGIPSKSDLNKAVVGSVKVTISK